MRCSQTTKKTDEQGKAANGCFGMRMHLISQSSPLVTYWAMPFPKFLIIISWSVYYIFYPLGERYSLHCLIHVNFQDPACALISPFFILQFSLFTFNYLCPPVGPVVQRIVCRFPEPEIEVRFLTGLQSGVSVGVMCGCEIKKRMAGRHALFFLLDISIRIYNPGRYQTKMG